MVVIPPLPPNSNSPLLVILSVPDQVEGAAAEMFNSA
jgi:hypothetical protein